MCEEWRAAPGYEGSYEVSNLGRVRNCRIKRFGPKGDYLRPQRGGQCKYQVVNLHANGVSKIRVIHRLVAGAFLGPCLPMYQVNHKDGNKFNNVVSNLEYVTPRQNLQHASRLGLMRKGETNPAHKLTEEAVRYIRLCTLSDRVLARRFSVDASAVRQARLARTWCHVDVPPRSANREASYRLDRNTVRYIRSTSIRTAVLAQQLNINEETVRRARLGHTWQDVGIPNDKSNFGERHHAARLDDNAVRIIRDSSMPNKMLAAIYGVGTSVISRVKNRKAWQHVR